MLSTKRARLAAVTACLLCALCLTGCHSADTSLSALYEQTATVLLESGTPTVGSSHGEWAVIGLSRSGKLTAEAAAGYLKEAEAYVQSVGSERLHPVKSTDNARMILGITAAGGDPTSIAGYDLTAGLADLSYVTAQGYNGPVWALIALDSKPYAIPPAADTDNQVTREKLVAYLLAVQSSDGGWGLMEGTSDVDMTAMALQALAPYQTQAEVSAATQRALTYLSERQQEGGGFESYGTANSESCSQVIVALTALGIDPLTDSRFIRNEATVLDALCTFAVEGGFCHQLSLPQADVMATEQAYYALTAYFRFKQGESALFDMQALS